MPAIPEPPPRLSDELIELRAIADWDIPDVLIAYQDDRSLHLALGQQRAPTGAQLGSEVERSEALRLAGERISMTLVEPGRNDCRGRIDVFAFDWERKRAELTIWVAPDFRGRGFAAHALTLAIGWLKREAGLDEVAVVVAVDEDALPS
jgi:RimJ/RimL family protein N-acetyltransferase